MIALSNKPCQVCKMPGTKNKDGIFLCENCRKSPFKIEALRDILYKQNQIKSFKKTYSKEYPVIKAINSDIVWSKEFKQDTSISTQDRMTQDKISSIIKFLPKRKRLRILDLGAGKGYFEELFKKTNENEFNKVDLTCVDISSKAINDLKKKYHGRFIRDDIKNINKYFNKNSFDAIIALELIEHIPPHETLTVFQQIYNLLDFSGKFLITTPTNEHLEKSTTNPSQHTRAYTENILFGELTISGFKIEKTRLLTAFQKNYRIKTAINKYIWNHWEPNNITIVAKKS